MSVNDGDRASATTFNNAYPSKSVDSEINAKYDFTNTDPVSGGAILNLQRNINSLASALGISPNQVYNLLITWGSTVVGPASSSAKDKIEALVTKFRDTQANGGHRHTGVDGEGAQISALDLLNLNIYEAQWQRITALATSGLSFDATSLLTGKVPNGSSSNVGIITSSPDNRVLLVDRSNGTFVTDAGGQTVYGRIDSSFLISFYTLESGVETAHNLVSTDLDIYFLEVFTIASRPTIPSFPSIFGQMDISNDIPDASALIAGKVNLVAQTFEGEKTFKQEIIAEKPVVMNEVATPSNPAAGKRKIYPKADGFYELDSAGVEKKIGTGSGSGVVNLITNGDAENASSSIFVPYQDSPANRPVDGVGGTPTVTTSISTVLPLIKTKSFLLTKPASNVQGQGWAIPFTVDPAYRAKSLKISVEYIINSGTFVAGSLAADGDLIWYIYDVSNSKLIEPSNIKMFSTDTALSDKFEATFQTSATGSSYRLIAHVASTSTAAFEIKVDDVTVQPNSFIFGNAISAWQAWTPTGTWTTNTTYTGRKRQVGSDYEYEILVALTGAPNNVQLDINLQETMDANVILTSARSDLGLATFTDTGVNTFFGRVAYFNATTIRIYSENVGGTSNITGNVNGTTPFAFGNGDVVMIRFKAPILGVPATTRMSDGYDGREISLKSRINGTLSVASGGTLPFTVRAFDKANFVNTSTGKVKVKTAGTYALGGFISSTSGTGFSYSAYVNNSIVDIVGVNENPTGLSTLQGLFELNAEDEIEVRTGAGSTFSYSGYLTLYKLSGSPSIAKAEKILLQVNSSSGQSIPNNVDQTVIWNNVTLDTHGIYNAATGRFKLPRAATGTIKSSAIPSSFTPAGNFTMWGIVYKNGAPYKYIGYKVYSNSGSATYAMIDGGSCDIQGVAGDEFFIAVFQNTGAARTLGGATLNWMDVTLE